MKNFIKMVTKDDREKNYRLFLCKILRKGGEAMDFDYFYNREAERFNFLKVPEILVDGEEFKGLSAEAIILYCISKTTRWTRGSVKALPMSRN